MTSSRRPQRNTTDGETDGGRNEDGARKQNQNNGGGARPETDNRAHNPRETSARRGSQDTRSRGAYPGEKTNTRPQRHRRNRRGRKGAEQRQPEGTEQGQPGEELPWPRREAKAVQPLDKPTDLTGREGSNSLPAEKKSPEDTATDRKGEPRGDQKSKRRKALRAAPPRTDRRDGEEKEKGLDHNQEKADGGAPPKGTEDPTY